MSYTIKPGISAAELPNWIKRAAKKLSTFEDGRVNYQNAEIAPIVMCTIVYKDKLLLVKRSSNLADANGFWSTVNGFIDEIKPVYQQVIQELREELQVVVDSSMIQVRKSYILKNPLEKRDYLVFPCLVLLAKKPKIILDSENTNYVWIKRAELIDYDTLDDLAFAIDCSLGQKHPPPNS